MSRPRPAVAVPTVIAYGLFGCGLLGGGLVGCGSLFPASESVTVYRLEAPVAVAAANHPQDWQLVVAEPQTPRGLDTDRIAVYPEPNMLQYYGEARWMSRAPRLVQDRLLEALEDCQGLRAVARSASAVRADLMLSSELRELHAQYHPGVSEPDVRVRLLLRLTDPVSNTVVASRSFARSGTAGSADILSVVRALDRELADLLGEAVAWVLASGDAWVSSNKLPSSRTAAPPPAALPPLD